jgi:hypothetical protein
MERAQVSFRDIAAQCPAGQRVVPNASCGARYTSFARQANDTFAERGMDDETLEILAIEVTSSSTGDPPMLPSLLDQIAPNQKIVSVTALSLACKQTLPGSGWGR